MSLLNIKLPFVSTSTSLSLSIILSATLSTEIYLKPTRVEELLQHKAESNGKVTYLEISIIIVNQTRELSMEFLTMPTISTAVRNAANMGILLWS